MAPNNEPAPTTGAVSALTDGTGISKLTSSKVLKDIVLDFLLSVPAALVAINIGGIETAVAAPVVTAFAIGDVAIRVGYRALLRWAQTP